MPTPKKPTAVLEFNGAFKHNPNRRPEGEPQPEGDVDPKPKGLSAYEQSVYMEIVEAAPPGVLTSADTHAAIIAARLEAEWRRVGTKMQSAKIGQLQKALASLGMNPADRSRISVKKKPDAGKFDDF